jgi:hypothetical protein
VPPEPLLTVHRLITWMAAVSNSFNINRRYVVVFSSTLSAILFKQLQAT